MKNNLTAHLKKFKNKEVGFNVYSKKECLRAVGQYPDSIRYIDNPSEAVQSIAIEEDPDSIEHIENPTEKIIIEAVRGDGANLSYVDLDKLSEDN